MTKLNREIWEALYPNGNTPNFPCPNCDHGRLVADPTASKVEEPSYSSELYKHDDFEPDWATERFYELLRCNNSKCGEIVIVSGDTQFVEVYDEEFGWGYASALRPRTFFPAPPIIPIPKNVPSVVRSEIEKAFSLFWLDVGSAGNRIRTSVEYVLDDLNVPRETKSSKNGALVRLDLNGRIQNFQKQSPELAKSFDALRIVGNLGSHTANLSRDVFLDALEIYEDTLVEIFDNRTSYLNALKDKIIKSKGNY